MEPLFERANRWHFHVRVLGLIAAVVATLAACGGGGGTGSASNGAAPAPDVPAVVSDFWSVALLKRTQTTQTLVVVDPGNPSAGVRWSAELKAQDSHATSWITRHDFAASTRRVVGATSAFYSQNGRVFQLNLRKSEALAPRRISSLDTVCSVDKVYQLSEQSDADGWIEVTEAGNDGDCVMDWDNRRAYVRITAAADTPALVPLSGTHVTTVLMKPGTAEVQFFLMQDNDSSSTSNFALYDPNMVKLADVAGLQNSTNFRLYQIGKDRLKADAFALVGNTLRKVSWSATGLTIGAPVHIFEDYLPKIMVDDEAIYYLDRRQLAKVNRNGSVSLLANIGYTTGGAFFESATTEKHLLIREDAGSGGSGGSYLTVVPKAGGEPVDLIGFQTHLAVVGVDGEDVIVSVPHLFEHDLSALFRVKTTTPSVHAELITSRAMTSFIHPLHNVRGDLPFDAQTRALKGVMWCETAASTPWNCSNGTLWQYELSSKSIRTVGNLSHPSASALWTLLPISGPWSPDEFILLSSLTAPADSPDNPHFYLRDALFSVRAGGNQSLAEVPLP